MIEVPPSATPAVARAITIARRLIAGATSENTRRAYETGWRQFTVHAQALGLEPLGAHPALVATFLGSLRDGGANRTGLCGLCQSRRRWPDDRRGAPNEVIRSAIFVCRATWSGPARRRSSRRSGAAGHASALFALKR
jgi:hypothetical protein